MRTKRTIRVLGIESSCDETAAAVVEIADSRKPIADSRGRFSFRVRSSVIASQVKIHAKYGGVVPEVAAREHVEKIMPVIERAMRNALPLSLPLPRGGGEKRREGAVLTRHASRPTPPPIDAIAVTSGPGLITALSVGAETARTLAYAWGKPLIAVNHIEGHVLSSLLSETRGNPKLEFPALALIVSGGHTELLLMRGWGKYECVGATRDDAAGEAFDKVGKLLGLPYPGGPSVAKAAEHGDPCAFDFPRGMLHSGDLDFSFSGLKTAVKYLFEKSRFQIPDSQFVSNICASFQAAAVDVLVAKTIIAAQRYGVKTVLLGGGVAANMQLRQQLGDAVRDHLPDSRFR
ncbi:MAG: tRNA (adenosine(37)-N6)-threonylcarbamoyltransferase complex transferase subunit TsaD, partial [bacterium]|nr:tRNA (adenosine(37)-N6)-threonylcarbamoyltransferase complex transferase subunit TsaD [bacterium]